LDVDAKRRFLALLKERFNEGARYRGGIRKWDTIIQLKTLELARYLTHKSKDVNFVEPSPNLVRNDSRETRNRILQLSQEEAKTLGIGKSTLHYLRKHARSDKSFKTYRKVAERIAVRGARTNRRTKPKAKATIARSFLGAPIDDCSLQ
jgi:hypothetical protein